MAEVVHTPEAARAAALAKIEAREKAIHANAVKQGRTAERTDILKALGVQTLEDASQLAQIRAERDARPTASEEQKHGRFRFYQGIAAGILAGLAASMCIMLFVVARMNEQTRASTEAGVMIGTAASSQSEREPAFTEHPRINPREPASAPDSN